MQRTPKQAAIRWGLVGLAIGFVGMLVVALASEEPGEPSDAMRKRGRASAPFVLATSAVFAGIGYVVTKRESGS